MKRSTIMLILAVEVMLVPLALWAGDEAQPDEQRHGRRPRAMDEAETAKVLEFVKTNWPEYHTRLLQVREENPRRFQMMLRGASHRMRQFEAMSEDEREARIRESKFKIEIYRLTKQYRTATDDEQKESLRKEISQAVAEAFDIEQKVREYGLQRLEKQLQQLRQELRKRTERRDAIIAERVRDILDAKADRPSDDHGDRPDHPRRPDGAPDGPPPGNDAEP